MGDEYEDRSGPVPRDFCAHLGSELPVLVPRCLRETVTLSRPHARLKSTCGQHEEITDVLGSDGPSRR